LDAGCGKGAICAGLLEQYRERVSQALYIGGDAAGGSSRLSARTRIAGSLDRVALLAASAFDFVYATESLAHAVDTAAEVDELCVC